MLTYFRNTITHVFRSGLLLVLISLFATALRAANYCEGAEFKINNATVEVVDSLINRALYNRLENESSLEKYGKRIICLSERNGFDSRLAYGHYILGMDFFLRSHIDSALNHLYLGYNNALAYENEELLCQSSNFIGLCFQSLGHPELALAYQQDFYDCGLRMENDTIVVGALTNIGSIYNNVGKFSKSKDLQLKALKIFENGDVEQENGLWLYRTLADSYAGINKNVDAIYYYKKALEIGKDLNFPRGTLWTLSSMIDLYVAVNIDSASYYLTKGKDMIDNVDNVHLSSTFLFQSARINQVNGNELKALEECDKAYHLANTDNIRILERRILNLALDISRKHNLVEKELKYLRFLQDNINRQVNDNTAASLSIWAKNQRKILDQHSENLALKEAEHEQKRKLHNQKLVIGTIGFVLLSLGVYICYATRLRNKTNEYNKSLLKKNTDIAIQLDIIQGQKLELEKAYNQIEDEQGKLKNELVQKMIYIANEREMLDDLAKILKDTAMSQDAKNQINSYIKRHDRETIWEEFDQQFSNDNEIFFAKLAKQAPKLTNNDFRLAALIKMNLDNKEIARLLYRSVDSIHMAKSRLRKKLKLDISSTNLVAYFNAIMDESKIN